VKKLKKNLFKIGTLFYRIYLRIFMPGYWHMRKFRLDLKIKHNKDNSKTVYYYGEELFKSIIPNFSLKSDTLFIVGSGPSIQMTNMGLLKDKDVFCVNGSIAVKDIYDIPVSYYIALDESFLENRLSDVVKAIESGVICFLSITGIKKIAEHDLSVLKGRTNIYIVEDYYEQYGVSMSSKIQKIGVDIPVAKESLQSKRPIIFSNAFDDGFFVGGTIIYSAIQIAVALGYTKICILGMDLGFSGNNARFYQEESPEATSYKEELENIIIPATKLAGDVLNKTVKIYNLSEKSKLPSTVFPKRKLEDVL